VTIYDAFRDGRKRVDAALVLDIVRALGADDAEVAVWGGWCSALARQAQSEVVVSSRIGPPPPLNDLIGRGPELVAGAASPRLLITGLGGVGKTQLALNLLAEHHAAMRIQQVIVVDVRGTGSDRLAHPSAVMEAVERSLALSAPFGATLADRADAVSTRLVESRIGLLLDDVGAEEQVRPFLRRALSVPIILTSRRALALPARVRMLDLAPLSTAEGLDLLRERIGATKVSEEADAALEIVELSGGLPLAVTLVAARIAQQNSWSLRDHQQALRRRRDALQLEPAVNAVVSGSYEALTPRSRRALRLFATQPCADLSDRQFAALIGVGADAASRIVDQLDYLNCISRPGPGRLGMHVLVRLFAAGRSWEEDAQAERDEALERLGSQMLQEAWAATDAIYPGEIARSRDPARIVPVIPAAAGSHWLRAELGHLIDVSRVPSPHRAEFVDALTEAIARFVHEQTSLPFAEAFFREAVEVVETGREGAEPDPSAVAIARRFLAQTLVSSGDPAALTELQRARTAAAQADLRLVTLSIMNSVGIVVGRGGDLHGARAAFAEVIAAAETVPGTEMLQVVVRDNAAIALYRLGDHIAAADEHRAAIRLAWSAPSPPVPAIAEALSNLADPLIAMGDLDGAETAAREASALAEGRSRKAALHAATALAVARLHRGDGSQALADLRRVGEHEEEIAEPSQHATFLLALGDALAGEGEHEEAMSCWRRALAIAVRASFHYEQARALLRLGCADAVGDPSGALMQLEQSVALFGTAGGAEPQRAAAEAERVRRLL